MIVDPSTAQQVHEPRPPYDDATDADLVAAVLEHRQDAAYLELVRRHQIPVFRRLALALEDPDDAESVCEATFVVASQRLQEWSREGSFLAWLFKVADEVSASRKGSGPDPNSPRLVDPAIFFKHSVHRALRSLDEDSRALLIAVDLEGQSLEEVAASRTLAVERVTEALEDARQRFTEALSRRDDTRAPARNEVPARVKPGEIIDKRYRVEELLGEGGMAAVFRAEHLAIHRKVAVKTLHPTRQTHAMIRERFVREAEVLGRLAHPNFVDISDFGESGRGMAYLVMELLEGRSLSSELRDSGRIHPARALRILREVCEGLAFAHELGIIHRDIKPDNIVILNGPVRPGFAKILDLGIAATGEDLETETPALYGTPEYMAPEQILGGRIDGRVDLYAVGITLFELLTGSVPFQGATTEFILAQQMTSPPKRLAEVAPDLEQGAALQELLDVCLAKEPGQRVGSAKLLQQRIDAVLARFGDVDVGGGPAVAGAGAREGASPPAQSASSGSARWVWLAVALAVAAFAVTWWLRR